MISLRQRLIGSSAVAGGLLLAAPALAQDNSGPVMLGPVQVEDAASRNAQSHDLKLSTSPTTSVQDTPQAVTVIDAQTMKQQATTTLGDALRNVPGITIAIGEGGTLAGDQFKIRGFDAKDDVYLDGLRDFAAYTRDSFNYDEVQVLKGPSGLMFGRGTTGGAINAVSKTAHLGDSYAVHAEGGNGDHFRATADLNYELSDTAAMRLNLMTTDTGVVDRDVTHSWRWGIAPTLSLGLGTDTLFTLSYIHQQTVAIPDYGLVVAQNPSGVIAEPVSEYGVPRSNFTGFSTDRDRNSVDIVTAKISHVATDWLTIENDARVADYSRYFQFTTVDRCTLDSTTNFCSNAIFGANPTTALAGIGGQGPYNQTSWGAQDIFSANANFHVAGMRNQLITGTDVSYQRADRTVYAYTLPTTAQFTYTLNGGAQGRNNIGISLYNPVHKPPPGYGVFSPTYNTIANSSATAATVIGSSGAATDLAFFATDRLWFTDDISLIAGVRVDKYDANYNSTVVGTTAGGTTTRAKSPSTLVNPRASLVWEPDQTTTVYLSYGKSAVPQGTSVVGSPTPITTANQALDPEKSETFEIGAKYGLWDGKLGLAASLFQVNKANAVITDPASGDVTLQSGQKQRVQGFELSATGQVSDNLSVIAAYTYLNPVITRDLSCTTTGTLVCDPNIYTIGRQITFVPKHAVSIWTDYNAKDWLPGLSFGGGIVYQSDLFNAYTIAGTAPSPTGLSRVVVIPETVELDAVAAYEFGNYRIALNVNNIADALNYSQSFGNRGTPAPGRSFIVSLDAKL